MAIALETPGTGRGGFAYGRPAPPEEKARKRNEKTARAPTLLAKAEAKRARKAAARKS